MSTNKPKFSQRIENKVYLLNTNAPVNSLVFQLNFRQTDNQTHRWTMVKQYATNLLILGYKNVGKEEINGC